MVITVEEARAYSRDYESTDEEMAALIEVAESMIDDGIRDGFDRESPQAKMLAKLLVTDLDDYRELTAAEANSMRYLTQSLKMQLRYKDVSNLDTSGVGRCEAMADYIDAGKLNKAAQVLELRETAPGVWEWTPVRRAWASITFQSKTNLFSKVGIGARDAAVIVRRQPLTLHHALRWGDTHLF